MVFTMIKDLEEAEHMDKVIEKNGRLVGPYGGRSLMEGFADWTLKPIPVGGQLINYDEDRVMLNQHDWNKEKGELAEETAVAIGEACKRGGVSDVQRLIGVSKLGGSPKELKVDMGFKLQGLKSIQTFMKALPADLEVLMVNLKGNMLMLPGIKVVAAGLPKTLKTLRVDLSQNKLHNAGVEIFMKSIPRCVVDLTLGFHAMPLRVEGARIIGDNLKELELVNLYIDLWGTELTDDGTTYIARRLPKTIEKFMVNIFGPNHLATRGHFIFQRLTENEGSEFHLPKLLPKNCTVYSKWWPQLNATEAAYAKDSPCVADRVDLWKPCDRQECPEPPDWVEWRNGPVPVGTWYSPDPTSSFKSSPADPEPR